MKLTLFPTSIKVSILLSLMFAKCAHATILVVNSNDDPLVANAGNCASGSSAFCTLRDAVAAAVGGDTIIFQQGVTTIVLTSKKQLEFADFSGVEITLNGNGQVTIDGNHQTRVIVTQPGSITSLVGVKIQNGYSAYDQGGGISNYGTSLRLSRATISNNETPGFGGGIATDGMLSIDSSTISGNIGRTGGGGIFINAATSVAIANSTIAANRTANGGGGISSVNGFEISIANSTLSDNIADAGASEFDAQFSSVTITNSLFNRTANPYGNNLCLNTFSTFVDKGGNFDSADSCGVDASHSKIPLMLGALQNNGGPTETILPAAGSPVIDANNCKDAPATDQRGISRPQGLQCDSGAVEVRLAATSNAAVPAQMLSKWATALLSLTLILITNKFVVRWPPARLRG